MLSKLVQLVQEHREPLAERVVRKIRADDRLCHIGSLPESDLRQRANDILERLGEWLAVRQVDEIARHFERIGARRFEERIPLQEAVLAYVLLKDLAIDYIRSQGMVNAVDLWAEEELEHHLGHFFDTVVYYLVAGYMQALEASLPALRAKAAASR